MKKFALMIVQMLIVWLLLTSCGQDSPQPPVGGVQPPVVAYFRTTDGRTEYAAGDQVQLEWSVSNASACFLSYTTADEQSVELPLPCENSYPLTATVSTRFQLGARYASGPENYLYSYVLITVGDTPPPPPDTHSLTVNKNGNGTINSSPLGINCGDDCKEEYDEGTSVTLSANPASGATFDGWSGDCSGAGSCVITMDEAKSVSANFSDGDDPRYTLSISKSGNGTITSSPAGINCGDDCKGEYDEGTSVTLSANPASGATFGGWSGDCSGTGSCVVTMDGAKSVSATFEERDDVDEYTLRVVLEGANASEGVVAVATGFEEFDCTFDVDCTATYPVNTEVVLLGYNVYEPFSNYNDFFTSGCDSIESDPQYDENNVYLGDETYCIVNMDSDKTVTVEFY